jgi:4-hydroxybenzoate polyprenyltransferase
MSEEPEAPQKAPLAEVAGSDLLAPPVSEALRGEAPPPRTEGPLWWRFLGVIRSVRPHQWVKNVFVLAPVVFAKEIFDPELLTRAASAFLIFCLLAGAVYTINDLADIEADRNHPVKRYRPIPSGQVPVAWAVPLALALVLGALVWAFISNFGFFVVSIIYFGQNLLYSFKLKQVAYLDVVFIAAGFVLRVIGGGFATEIHVSKYLLLCTALLALFLGFGKRRHELAVATRAREQRAALDNYSVKGLDLALGVTAMCTVLTYLVYTLDSNTTAFFRTDWLWLSTLFVMLGVGRFLQLVRTRPRAESPTQEMLRDGPFVAIILGWVILVMWVVYHLRPS